MSNCSPAYRSDVVRIAIGIIKIAMRERTISVYLLVKELIGKT